MHLSLPSYYPNNLPSDPRTTHINVDNFVYRIYVYGDMILIWTTHRLWTTNKSNEKPRKKKNINKYIFFVCFCLPYFSSWLNIFSSVFFCFWNGLNHVRMFADFLWCHNGLDYLYVCPKKVGRPPFKIVNIKEVLIIFCSRDIWDYLNDSILVLRIIMGFMGDNKTKKCLDSRR